MPTRVRMPDGKIAEFPDGMKPEDIDAAITTHYSATPEAAAAAAANPFGNAPAHAPAPPVTGGAAVLQKMAAPDPTPVTDLAKGIAKSGASTLANVDDAVRSHGGRVGQLLTTPLVGGKSSDEANADLHALATPQNTPQAIGKMAGDVGQFFIPGGAEEAAAAKAAPYVGKALPFVKMGLAGAGSAAVNKAEGGTASSGFFGGALGSAVGHGIQAVAPVLAETALGVRAADRAYGRTPGQFIIDKTTGVNPGTIADQASEIVGRDTNRLNQNALMSTSPVNLQPARTTASSFLRTAELQNNPDLIRDVERVGDQLALRPGGIPIPSRVSPYQGLALKRGLTALTDYNPNLTQGLGDAAVKGTVKSMEPELSNAIPGYEDLNSSISTGIPVAKRAGAADLNANVLQRTFGRFARPTGALVVGGLGAGEGIREHNPVKALAYGLGGVVAPEILASPETIMAGARFANAAGSGIGTLGNGVAQQAVKKLDKRDKGD